ASCTASRGSASPSSRPAWAGCPSGSSGSTSTGSSRPSRPRRSTAGRASTSCRGGASSAATPTRRASRTSSSRSARGSSSTVARIARLLHAARRARVPVFHCTMSRRPDGGGAVANCLLLAAARKGTPLLPGSSEQAVVAPLAPVDGDYVVTRFHGVTPFHGTELDALLRNLGVRTVVASGVSVNVGIVGVAIEAVNAGYQV